MCCALKKQPLHAKQAAALCSWAADLIQTCDQTKKKENLTQHLLKIYI